MKIWRRKNKLFTVLSLNGIPYEVNSFWIIGRYSLSTKRGRESARKAAMALLAAIDAAEQAS